MNKRNRIIIFTLLAAALMSVSLVVIIQLPPREVKEAYGSYSLEPKIDLVDKLKQNPLYGNNSELINPSVIYTNITSNLSLELYLYFFDTNLSSSTVSYNYTVMLRSSDPSWTHVSYFRTGAVEATSGDFKPMAVGLNVSSNVSLGEKINQELGFGNSGTFSLLFNFNLSSNIGRANENLTLALGSVTDTIAGTSYSNLTGTLLKNAVIPGRIIIPLDKVFAYPLFAVAVLFLGIAATQIERRKKSYTEKFKAENHEVIIELKSGPPEGSIEVRSAADILRMALLLEKPAFSNSNLIFLEIDGKTYYAEIRDED